jgi:hypothetical protein
MAKSRCIKCDNSSFEIVENTPHRSVFKLMFVQCTSCGGVVGVLDFYNIGERLTELARKLGVDLSS